MIDLQEWADALDSGEFQQTYGAWKVITNSAFSGVSIKHCAIGVGIEVSDWDFHLIYEDDHKMEYGPHEQDHDYLNDVVDDEFGFLTQEVVDDLQEMGIGEGDIMKLNDTRLYPFEDIADGLRILDSFRKTMRNQIDWRFFV